MHSTDTTATTSIDTSATPAPLPYPTPDDLTPAMVAAAYRTLPNLSRSDRARRAREAALPVPWATTCALWASRRFRVMRDGSDVASFLAWVEVQRHVEETASRRPIARLERAIAHRGVAASPAQARADEREAGRDVACGAAVARIVAETRAADLPGMVGPVHEIPAAAFLSGALFASGPKLLAFVRGGDAAVWRRADLAHVARTVRGARRDAVRVYVGNLRSYGSTVGDPAIAIRWERTVCGRVCRGGLNIKALNLSPVDRKAAGAPRAIALPPVLVALAGGAVPEAAPPTLRSAASR